MGKAKKAAKKGGGLDSAHDEGHPEPYSPPSRFERDYNQFAVIVDMVRDLWDEERIPLEPNGELSDRADSVNEWWKVYKGIFDRVPDRYPSLYLVQQSQFPEDAVSMFAKRARVHAGWLACQLSSYLGSMDRNPLATMPPFGDPELRHGPRNEDPNKTARNEAIRSYWAEARRQRLEATQILESYARALDTLGDATSSEKRQLVTMNVAAIMVARAWLALFGLDSPESALSGRYKRMSQWCRRNKIRNTQGDDFKMDALKTAFNSAKQYMASSVDQYLANERREREESIIKAIQKILKEDPPIPPSKG